MVNVIKLGANIDCPSIFLHLIHEKHWWLPNDLHHTVICFIGG
jgi:hypothetical protein